MCLVRARDTNRNKCWGRCNVPYKVEVVRDGLTGGRRRDTWAWCRWVIVQSFFVVTCALVGFGLTRFRRIGLVFGFIGEDQFEEFYSSTCLCRHGYMIPISVTTLPDGFKILPFYISMVMFVSNPYLIGLLLARYASNGCPLPHLDVWLSSVCGPCISIRIITIVHQSIWYLWSTNQHNNV
jgi:hypothetical protein